MQDLDTIKRRMTPRELTVMETFFEKRMSLRDTADAVGIAKNSVAGITSRMRAKYPELKDVRPPESPLRTYQPRKEVANSGSKPRPKAPRRARPSKAPARPAPRPANVTQAEAYRLGLLRAPVSPSSAFPTCQWFEGDPKDDAPMCGAESAPGAPYCPEHCCRAYRTAEAA